MFEFKGYIISIMALFIAFWLTDYLKKKKIIDTPLIFNKKLINEFEFQTNK